MSFNYVIGSGWWSKDNEGFSKERKKLGDDFIRSPEFHHLWYESISRYTTPNKIIIVDSASPQKPPLNLKDGRIEFISLDKNYGHATNCIGKFGGWLRSCLLGVAYAWMCDADYFVYVEQDVLLYGEGIIEHAISRMNHSFMFGRFGQGLRTKTPQPLQQSFFIIKKPAYLEFMQRMEQIRGTDQEIFPEIKFTQIRYNWLPKALIYTRFGKLWRILTADLWYDWLPYGYGRERPLNWNDPFFYFQHGTINEIQQYIKLTGFKVTLDGSELNIEKSIL